MDANIIEYRGKLFTKGQISKNGFVIVPDATRATISPSAERSLILRDLNTIWDLKNFEQPRIPITIDVLSPAECSHIGSVPLPRILDMPIKFPGSLEYRLPQELEGIRDLIQRIADYEAKINSSAIDYYCYLTIDRGNITPGECLREAPCHVDGFQGSRWQPKKRVNHTYSCSDVLPTTYYVQPFDFSGLKDDVHNFFWEMNRQVALTNSLYAWQAENGGITLMDGYTVHRGTETAQIQSRTFVRMSFEERIFDRLGNAHNPMFEYNWEMVPRDIEALNLVPFDPQSNPSLRVFPHQNLDGTPRDETEPSIAGGKRPTTKPILKPDPQFCGRHVIYTPSNEYLSDQGWLYKRDLIQLTK
eukprot:TRINITY_DN12897_c0_g1_i1.p1 TRINITY_DN12897_c0_g1~~TRINITY_DN12897_c0_g1_i1.p1  ORF type:complete len:359 (-),score=50.24 TRINITY_DN12897_c0_g1_i1:64-1140(-)